MIRDAPAGTVSLKNFSPVGQPAAPESPVTGTRLQSANVVSTP